MQNAAPRGGVRNIRLRGQSRFVGGLCGFGRVGADQPRWCRDVGNHEIAVDRGLCAFGQNNIRDVQHIADIAAVQIDGDVIGNVTRGDDQFDFGTHYGQNTAALEARRFLLVDEFDRDEQGHARGAAQAHQVDMGWQILDNVALNATADHGRSRAHHHDLQP